MVEFFGTYGKSKSKQISDRKILFSGSNEAVWKKVVIYGAGRVGRDYYAQISRYSSCTILAWIDSYPENTSIRLLKCAA